MEEIFAKLPEWIEAIAKLLGGLCLVATPVSKYLVKGDKDDVAVKSFGNQLAKVLAWFPTIGINPRTKKLEEILKEK